MKIQAHWRMSNDYYREYWKDWIKTISKGRKWVLPLGIGSLTLWLVFYTDLIVIPIEMNFTLALLFFFAVFEIAWHFFDKQRWLRRMVRSSDSSSEIKLTFSSEGISMESSQLNGELKWGALKNVIPSPNGLFLIMQKGICIYIPESAMNTEHAKQRIMEMFREDSKSHCSS